MHLFNPSELPAEYGLLTLSTPDVYVVCCIVTVDMSDTLVLHLVYFPNRHKKINKSVNLIYYLFRF